MAEYVYGIETGLSSDPEMNWQINELSTRSILSFSDAHSPAKMGREATVFRLEKLSYSNIREAIMSPRLRSQGFSNKNSISYTIEFYPEEGKYHYSGHRKCSVYYTPQEITERGSICPVCKRRLTDGVKRRVLELLQEEQRGCKKLSKQGVIWTIDPKNIHPPFVKIIPLLEIIAEGLGTSVTSIKTKALYMQLCNKLNSEFSVLLYEPITRIEKIAGARVAEGVERVRKNQLVIQPGYDGVYGTVRIWKK